MTANADLHEVKDAKNSENIIQNIDIIKADLIAQIDKRLEEKIIEPTNAELLKKLISKAESTNEAIMIAELGTTYKRTGFHFDKRLEKMGTDIKFLKKNTLLSFVSSNNEETDRQTGNAHKLIIGDNYDALLNLLITHKGAIDMIYIDPPYGSDSMGNFADTNYTNSITRDNLLSMLYPRLILAKQLLSDSGVIFCSIDDKNQAYIKLLMDDVFNERNFVACYLWKKTDTPPALSNKVRKKYEYILCYQKEIVRAHKFSQGLIDGGDAPLLNAGNAKKAIRFPAGCVHFHIPDGEYRANDELKIHLLNTVIVKNGTNENDFVAEGEWKWSQDTLLSEVANGTCFLVKSPKFSIRYQRKDIDAVKAPQSNLDSELGVGTNEDGEKELKNIFAAKVFDNPKPTTLIKFLIKMINSDNDITILDFFAGSGTTGHAVLELNKEDGGNRQFILCTNNEETVTTPNGIAYDVTSKRLKRVMTGECYDGSSDFEWLENNEPYGDNLDVYDIVSVNATEQTEGKSPFDVIDETCYDMPKFTSVQEKIAWVCSNFENTQKYIEKEE